MMSDNKDEEDQEYLERARATDADEGLRICLLSFGLGVVFYAAAQEISTKLEAAERREE
jgi:hypothetical protein